MNVRNCRKCGRIFNYLTGPQICPACKENLEEKFQEVKEYIRKNELATIPEVSEECSVEINQIKQWIREERLTFSENSVVGIECENCGALIKTGRFCERCKADIAKGLLDVTKKEIKIETPKKDSRDSARMRFLDKH